MVSANRPGLLLCTDIECTSRVIEVHFAIVCACLPAGKPFLRRYLPKIIGSNDSGSDMMRRCPIQNHPNQRLSSGDGIGVGQEITFDGKDRDLEVQRSVSLSCKNPGGSGDGSIMTDSRRQQETSTELSSDQGYAVVVGSSRKTENCNV